MHKYKIGDKVKCILGNAWLREGDVGVIKNIEGSSIIVYWNNPMRPNSKQLGGLYSSRKQITFVSDRSVFDAPQKITVNEPIEENKSDWGF